MVHFKIKTLTLTPVSGQDQFYRPFMAANAVDLDRSKHQMMVIQNGETLRSSIDPFIVNAQYPTGQVYIPGGWGLTRLLLLITISVVDGLTTRGTININGYTDVSMQELEIVRNRNLLSPYGSNNNFPLLPPEAIIHLNEVSEYQPLANTNLIISDSSTIIRAPGVDMAFPMVSPNSITTATTSATILEQMALLNNGDVISGTSIITNTRPVIAPTISSLSASNLSGELVGFIHQANSTYDFSNSYSNPIISALESSATPIVQDNPIVNWLSSPHSPGSCTAADLYSLLGDDSEVIANINNNNTSGFISDCNIGSWGASSLQASLADTIVKAVQAAATSSSIMAIDFYMTNDPTDPINPSFMVNETNGHLLAINDLTTSGNQFFAKLRAAWRHWVNPEHNVYHSISFRVVYTAQINTVITIVVDGSEQSQFAYSNFASGLNSAAIGNMQTLTEAAEAAKYCLIN